MLPHLNDGQIVELGSGWGTLIFPLARRFPQCQVVGYEISPIPYFVSKVRAFFFPLPNLRIIRKDFFTISLNQVSLIVCYLYPKAMDNLKKKFETEMKQNSFVISHTFAVPGWIPAEIKFVSDLYFTPIYFYKI